MATQQAWDDFNEFKSKLSYSDALIKVDLKNSLEGLENFYEAVIADTDRTVAAVALADTHPVYTSTYVLNKVTALLALKTYLQNNGYFG